MKYNVAQLTLAEIKRALKSAGVRIRFDPDMSGSRCTLVRAGNVSHGNGETPLDALKKSVADAIEQDWLDKRFMTTRVIDARVNVGGGIFAELHGFDDEIIKVSVPPIQRRMIPIMWKKRLFIWNKRGKESAYFESDYVKPYFEKRTR